MLAISLDISGHCLRRKKRSFSFCGHHNSTAAQILTLDCHSYLGFVSRILVPSLVVRPVRLEFRSLIFGVSGFLCVFEEYFSSTFLLEFYFVFFLLFGNYLWSVWLVFCCWPLLVAGCWLLIGGLWQQMQPKCLKIISNFSMLYGKPGQMRSFTFALTMFFCCAKSKRIRWNIIKIRSREKEMRNVCWKYFKRKYNKCYYFK